MCIMRKSSCINVYFWGSGLCREVGPSVLISSQCQLSLTNDRCKTVAYVSLTSKIDAFSLNSRTVLKGSSSQPLETCCCSTQDLLLRDRILIRKLLISIDAFEFDLSIYIHCTQWLCYAALASIEPLLNVYHPICTSHLVGESASPS